MNQSKISVRYSKALFSVALEKKVLDKVYNDLLLIYTTCKMDDFANFLESLIIPPSKKKEIVKEIFGNKIQDVSLSFLNLIIENKREPFLLDISRKFIDDYKKYKDIKTAKLITASEIDNSLKTKLVKTLENYFKSKIELEATINKDLIGGYILNLDDKQYDSSVSSQLKIIEKELLNTSIDKK